MRAPSKRPYLLKHPVAMCASSLTRADYVSKSKATGISHCAEEANVWLREPRLWSGLPDALFPDNILPHLQWLAGRFLRHCWQRSALHLVALNVCALAILLVKGRKKSVVRAEPLATALLQNGDGAKRRRKKSWSRRDVTFAIEHWRLRTYRGRSSWNLFEALKFLHLVSS